jgi:hypothetical protein
MKISSGGGSSTGVTSSVLDGRLFVPPAYYQTAGDRAVRLDSADDWIALRFTPEIDFRISSVCVYITEEATRGDGTLELYSHDATNDRPNASLQVLGTLNSGGSADSWVRLAVSAGAQYQLMRNRTYWLVHKGSGAADFSPSTRRRHTGTGSMFPDGTKTMTTTDGGSSWNPAQQDSKDACWNVIINGGPDHVPKLHFGRADGRYVFIPGSGSVQIPEEGVLLDCSTLTADTEYNVYVYDDNGTPALEASTTGRVTSNGIEVKAGSTTKRFLGMIRPKEIQAGKQGPVDVGDRRLVGEPGVGRSIVKLNPYVSETITSQSAVDTWERLLSDAFRVEFLVADGIARVELQAVFGAYAKRHSYAFALDSDSVPDLEHTNSMEAYYFGALPVPTIYDRRIGEGFHYIVPLWNVDHTDARSRVHSGDTSPGYYFRTSIRGRIS